MDPIRLKTMLLSVPNGSPVIVRTRDGAQWPGKLLGVSNDGFEVQTLVNDSIETRALAFSDVVSLEAGPRKTRLAKILDPMLTVLSLVGTVAALTAAIK